MDVVRKDLGLALRMLRLRPGLAMVILMTLALGIGANTAVFSVVRSVILRPLPFPEDERLAALLLQAPTFNMADLPSSPPEYVVYRDHARSWERLAAYRVRAATITEEGDEPERITVAYATWSLFPVLDVEPMLGRWFTEDEGRPGSDDVAVLSHAFWTARYAGDPNVLGRSVSLDGTARTIVGVMPPDFRFPSPDVRFWLPIAFSANNLQYRGNHSYQIVGRLRRGATLASAEAEIAELMARVSYEGLPDFHQWHPGTLRPLRTEIVGDVSRTLWVMLAAAGLVLLIACANVANLLLVRSEERVREMWIRTALGAGRGRLVSQLLVESLVMAVAGGAAGVALAYMGVDALRGVAPADLPRLDEVRMDATVLGFTTLVTMGAGLLFGLVPALLVGGSDLQSSLRAEGRSGTAGRGRIRLRQLLVVSETALAVVLLVAAGLLLQSFRKLMAVDAGFSAERVLTASITIPETRYAEGEHVVGFYETLLPRIRSLPGVTAAGAAVSAPLAGRIGATDVAIEGWVDAGDAPRPLADAQAVTPGYFQAMGIPPLEGRVFEDRDRLDAPLVAIVSEALARAYWPGRSAIGGRIRVDGDDEHFAQVVGVVREVRYAELDRPPERGTLYLVHAQTPLTWDTPESMTLTVRTSTEPSSLVSAIRAKVQALDPSVPVYDVRTMEGAVADASATRRFSMLLQLLFALVALSLAALGLYGVLAFTVARRTAEIGIRMALGAGRSEVQRMVVRQGMAMVVLALALGVAGALAASRLLRSLLFEVSPDDPATYVAVVGILSAVALAACWIPARRASGVRPADSLRAQ